MDWNSKAQAIWATLDNMAAKDPDGYKKFIQQQMEGAQDFFRETKNTSDFLDTVKGAGIGMNELFPAKAAADSKTTNTLCKKDKKEESVTNLANQLEKMEIQKPLQKSSVETENKLTDDVFTLKSSLLSTIVKDEDTCEEKDSVIVDIRLPSDSERKQQESDKPAEGKSSLLRLIEEL